jgi:hypothetical protein
LKEIEKALASSPLAPNPTPTVTFASPQSAPGVDPLTAMKGLEELAKNFRRLDK